MMPIGLIVCILSAAGLLIAIVSFAQDIHGTRLHSLPRSVRAIVVIALLALSIYSGNQWYESERKSSRTPDQLPGSDQKQEASLVPQSNLSIHSEKIPRHRQRKNPDEVATPEKPQLGGPLVETMHITDGKSETTSSATRSAEAGNSGSSAKPANESQIPVNVPPNEELAEPGTVRGAITVCKFGVVPQKQQYAGDGAAPAEICLKTDDGRVVKIPYKRYFFGPAPPPIYYGGSRYSIFQLVVGDYIECRIATAETNREEGVLMSPSGVRPGEPTLQDAQILKWAARR